MLTAEQVEQFHRDGYLLGGRVLSDDQLERLRSELTRVIDAPDAEGRRPVLLRNLRGDDNAPVWQIVNIWQASDAFRDLAFHPTIVEEVAQLTGARQLRVWHDQIQYKPAATGGVNMWHQDSPSWPVLQPKTAQVTAWIALDDVDVDNGCMSMVPGSHAWGPCRDELRKLEDYDDLPITFRGHAVRRELRPVKAGHVHYHHALTWHGSHANRSGRPRRAIAVHYMTEATRYDASGEHPMKPYITVPDGAMLEGDAFPLVYDVGRVVAPTAVG